MKDASFIEICGAGIVLHASVGGECEGWSGPMATSGREPGGKGQERGYKGSRFWETDIHGRTTREGDLPDERLVSGSLLTSESIREHIQPCLLAQTPVAPGGFSSSSHTRDSCRSCNSRQCPLGPRQIFISKGWSETISPNYVTGVTDAGIARLHLKAGQWTHIVLVYARKEGYTASYFDGEGRCLPHPPEQPFNTGKPEVWLGSRASGTGGGEFILDDFKFFARAISPQEIPQVAGASFPPPRNYLSLGMEVDPKRAVETPHRKWAKPYAYGRLRVLFVSEGVKAREFFELAERFDIEPLVVTSPAFRRHTLINPEPFRAVAEKVERILKAGFIDCIVLGAYGWNLFPAETRKAVLDYVREGGGLLFSVPRCVATKPGNGIVTNNGRYWEGWQNTPEGREIEALVSRLSRDDEEYLIGGTPWNELSMFTVHLRRQPPSALFRGGRIGKGRILLYYLHHCGSTTASLTPGVAYIQPLDFYDYEYAIAVAARAVIWASGRASPLRIRRVEFRSTRSFRNLTVGIPGWWELDLENTSKEEVAATVELSAHSRSHQEPFTTSRNLLLKPGFQTLLINYTLDRIGSIFCDARLLVDGKVADWRTGIAVVDHGVPWLYALSLSKEAFTPEEVPVARAKVALKDYTNDPPQPGELHWELYDVCGRMVARGQMSVEFSRYDELPTELTWTLPPLDPVSLNYRLVANLYRQGRRTDQKEVELFCRRIGTDDFVFFSWTGAHGVVPSLATRLLRDRYNLQSVIVPAVGEPVGRRLFQQLRWANRMNLRPWVCTTHLGGRTNKYFQRDLDTSDENHRHQLCQRLRKIAKVSLPYSPLFYSLGDEVKLGPIQAEPTGPEQEAFRIYLQQKYGSTDALNKLWKTNYKSWLEVEIPSSKVMREGRANPHLYAELDTFRNRQFANLLRACTEAIRSVAPEAKVGPEGLFGLNHPWGAFDYSMVVPATTFLGQYALGWELDIIRSFQKPTDIIACWYNYQMLNPGYSRYGPWHFLLRGGKFFGWYNTFEGSRYTALRPDFTPFEQFRWTYEELEPILNGIGKLILTLQREDSGVYLLFEHRNLRRVSPQYHAMLIMTRLLEDAGLQYSFISADDVSKTKLLERDVKVLILLQLPSRIGESIHCNSTGATHWKGVDLDGT